MDYIINGYAIPIEYDFCVGGVLFYIPSNLPKDTQEKLECKLKDEQDVVSISPVQTLSATYRGDAFQEAADKLEELYSNADLKFFIDPFGTDI